MGFITWLPSSVKKLTAFKKGGLGNTGREMIYIRFGLLMLGERIDSVVLNKK